jgi:uncharacterized membrane protein YfcA
LDVNVLLILLASVVTSAVGALGGLGGAVLLVPFLVVIGMPVAEAAPIGLVSVAALSVAAAPTHLRYRVVNHRLGLTTELASSAGAIVGALVSDGLDDQLLVDVLAAVSLTAAFAGGRRMGMRNLPDPALGAAAIGERVGTLAGAYPLNGGVVPYRAIHLKRGLGLMGISGLIAGMAGVSGGFVKTPATSEVMHVPTKVAAATTTFTIGVTAASALAVFAVQGRIDPEAAAASIAGSLVGSMLGVRFQMRLVPSTVRLGLSILLVLVAIVLVVS